MKRFLILSIALIAMAATPVIAGDSESYGDGVTLDEAVAIEVLLSNPNDYVGRKVRVESKVHLGLRVCVASRDRPGQKDRMVHRENPVP